MGIAYVQDSGATTHTISITTTTGNTLLTTARDNGSSPTWPSNLNDSASNTWTYPTAANNAAPPGAVWSTNNVNWIGYAVDAASVTSVSVTESGTFAWDIAEFSGVAAAETGVTNSGTSSAPSISGISYNSGDLIVLWCVGASSPGAASGSGTWTNFSYATSSANRCYQIMSGSGSLSVSWANTLTAWAVCAQQFSASSTGVSAQLATALAPLADSVPGTVRIGSALAAALAPLADSVHGTETIGSHAATALAPLADSVHGTAVQNVSAQYAASLAPLAVAARQAGADGAGPDPAILDDRSAMRRTLIW